MITWDVKAQGYPIVPSFKYFWFDKGWIYVELGITDQNIVETPKIYMD